jgi:ADP-ribosylglycohydrolase
MYMGPVGVVNAADPAAAYAEAIDLAGAHQSSYGREAAGVYAAAVAAAMVPGATAAAVIDACVDLAHDGTRAAIEAACSVTAPDWQSAIPLLRKAIEPFDTVGPEYRAPAMDARRPSRTKAIEELPVALGLVLLTGGSYREAVLGGVNYGRDADSIASMAGAITGALGGLDTVPAEWRRDVSAASKTDIETPGKVMAGLANELAAADAARAQARASAMARLTEQ